MHNHKGGFNNVVYVSIENLKCIIQGKMKISTVRSELYTLLDFTILCTDCTLLHEAMEAIGLHHVQFKHVKHSWKADVSWGWMTEFRDVLSINNICLVTNLYKQLVTNPLPSASKPVVLIHS